MYGFKVASLAILATAAFAQDTSLPSCAASCVGGNYAGCSTLNVACICGSSAWISGLTCCVANTCSPADQEATIQYANKICAGVGITTLPQSAVCTSTASSGSSASAATAASSTSTTSVSGSSASTTASSSTSSSTTAATTASSTSASTAPQTTNAAAFNKAGSIGMGALLAGIAVVL